MRALVRRPSPRLSEGLLTHLERVPVDADLAQKQWEGYVATLAENGFDPVQVEAADECPDGVFIEDSMVVYGDLAVLSRPAVERRGELATARAAAEAAGLRIAEITEPGTLEGGDVLKVGSTVYVGISGRTNAEGSAQLAAHLAPLGATVVNVPLTKVLHLKTAITALPDGTVIGYRPLVDAPEMFPAFLDVPEEEGSHVVLLGDGKLLMSSAAPQSAELFRERGYVPIPVDISEFEKMEGCVTCLSVRLRG